jgi:hypothetical protein
LPLRRPTWQRAGDARQVQSTDRASAGAPLSPDRALQETARSGDCEPRSAASCNPTSAAAARFTIALEPDGRPAGFRLQATTPRSTIGPRSRKAPICCARTSAIGAIGCSGKPIQLTQAEAAFRIQKDQLNVRPIWRQREDRVQTHILVCFLAFALWKSLEMWQQRAGLGKLPARHSRRAGAHPVARRRSADRNTRPDPPALRRSTRPRPGVARLGIILTKRMRLPEQELPRLAHSA